MTQSKDGVPPRLEALVMSWHITCYFNSIGYNSLFICKYLLIILIAVSHCSYDRDALALKISNLKNDGNKYYF